MAAIPAASSDGSDGYAQQMKGPGAWPETDESQLHAHQTLLRGVLDTLKGAHDKWSGHSGTVFAPNNWSGKSATAGQSKSESHHSEMSRVEQHIRDTISWCGEAAGHITAVKDKINKNVDSGLDEISDFIRKASDPDNKISGEDLQRKIDEIIKRKRGENASTLTDHAESIGGKSDRRRPSQQPDSPGTADEGREPDSRKGQANFLNASSQISTAKDTDGGADEFDRADGDGSAQNFYAADPAPKDADAEANSHPSVPGEAHPQPAGSSTEPVKETASAADHFSDPPPVFASPNSPAPQAPSPAGKTPQMPGVPGASTGPSVGTGPSAGGGGASGAGGGAPSSPLSSIGSAGASSVEQAAGPAQAAGQAPVGGAPTDPLQAFSKGFADSAGTPVHAASSGGAPPPLAPSPAVPASDAMTPASTQTPVAQTGGPATAPPVQTPASGGPMGGMGGGMGGMPLGPPPTAPPAAPVAPPAAAPPPTVAPPANIAGGAQVAPIPVSAARAERDAAQNAAKRSSDPLVLARRIAAALNAPDMLNVEDFDFYWITALTAQGQIVVANNYGLAYLPAQVRLPEQVKFVSVDESIPASERASFAIHPMVAVQRWAQHHDTTLRAVIGAEEHFANSDAGAHKVVLTPEDIPAKGQMAGRDRLQVVAPQIAMRLAGFSDADLVNILPPASADTSPPEDRRTALWEAVWEPLCSSASNRGQVHLQAFLAYAIHAQEWAVYEAHAATDGPDQRRAVTDFIYWQHVGQLIADGLDA